MKIRRGTIGTGHGAVLTVLSVVVVLWIMTATVPGNRVWAGAVASTDSGQGTAATRMRKEIRRLRALRRSHRKEIFALPGVVGLGTAVRVHPDRAVITIYVTKDTPELRAEIESRLPGEPVEIIEKARGFRAY